MKRIIFLLIAVSLTIFSLSAQTFNDSKAKSLYFKAAEDYEINDYKGALAKIAEAEKILGGTNARLSYLTAKSQYKLSNFAAAQDACKKYFASTPKKDAGYDEMQKMSEAITARIQAEAQQRAAEAEARRDAEAERMRKEQEEAHALELQMQLAAERRALDAEMQAVLDAETARIFKEVQAKNTPEAYQEFIYQYSYGKLTEQAKSEMQKKWPAPVRTLKNNKYGFIDKQGKMVVKASYDYASEFSEGLARVGKGGKYGFVNDKGKVVIPIQYVAASNFNYGLAVVKTADNKSFFVDKTGKALNENVYQDAKSFSEGLAAVQNQYYKYGFINPAGELVIPYEYSVVSWFKDGIAAVGISEGGKTLYAYIDQTGDQLTEFEFEEAKDFQNGVGRVKKGGKYGLVDKFGSPITCCEFDYISEFAEDGLALAKKGNFDVYLDKEGRPWAKVNNKLVKINL